MVPMSVPNLMPMTHDYSTQKIDTKNKIMKKPKQSSLNFIRQFARTYVVMQGCSLGTMVIN